MVYLTILQVKLVLTCQTSTNLLRYFILLTFFLSSHKNPNYHINMHINLIYIHKYMLTYQLISPDIIDFFPASGNLKPSCLSSNFDINSSELCSTFLPT